MLGRILLERRVLVEEELRRVVGERDDLIRRGGRVTLAQLLVRDRRIDPTSIAAIQGEIELRGRACYGCRRAYLVPPGGAAECPQCGGPALLPALLVSSPPPSSDEYSPSGRFPPISPSGRFAPPQGSASSSAVMRASANGSSGRGNVFGNLVIPAAKPSGSSRLIPSLVASPQPPDGPRSTDPGSNGTAVAKQGTELKTLGAYDLLSELGRGGMGVVYKAQHRQTGQIVALKVLLSGEFASPKMLARFKEEAAVVQKLEHPNVVPIFEVGEIDGINYFTMKFVEGDLFQALLKGRGLSARRGAEIVRDVARGAHHAHETGIVHRDLKPANVIVERETGTPFIMDFGLAKDLDDDKGLSKTGVAIGTPYYMPPEQAQGKHREIDPRSDVYALGAMLYEVLARKVPFNAESQTLLLRKIVEEEPIPPSQIRQGVPPDLETIALKALKKPKDERYPSAEALAKDIERALSGKQIKAKRDPAWKPIARKLAKHPKVLAIVGVTLLVLAGAISFGLYVYFESERAKKEEQRRKDQADFEKKQRDQEEADLKRRTEAESWLTKGHSKRLQARLSPSYPSARATLEDAIEAFTNAFKLTDEDSEARACALYERALCTIALHKKEALPAALEDLRKAAGSKSAPARARLALGVASLRGDHDSVHARDEFDMGKTAGQPADSTAKRDEEAAALICQSYIATIDGQASSGIRLAQDATPRSDDLAVEAGAAESWARLPNVKMPGLEATELARLLDKLVTTDRWSFWLHLDRAQTHAVVFQLQQAGESMQAAREVEADNVDWKLIDAWIRTAVTSQPDALKKALEEARRDQPSAQAYWDQMEKRYKESVANLKLLVQKQQRQQTPPDKPKKPPGGEVLWSDVNFDVPNASQPRLPAVRELIGAGKKDEALAALRSLIQDYPECPSFRTWLALFFVETKQPLDAKPLVDGVLEKLPSDAFALTVKGLCEMELGNVAQAKAAYEKVTAANPNMRTPRILYGSLLRNLGEFAAAEAMVKPLYVEDPSDFDAATILAFAWTNQERAEEGLALARKLMAARPSSFEPRVCAATALRRLRRYDEDLKLVDETIKLLGERFLMLVERAFALWASGKTDEAEEAVKKARAAASPDELKQLERVWAEFKAKFPRK